jgi:hypothetical protein
MLEKDMLDNCVWVKYQFRLQDLKNGLGWFVSDTNTNVMETTWIHLYFKPFKTN